MQGSLVMVTLGGMEFSMRPAFEVYRDIEARTKYTLRELYDCGLMGRLTLEEATHIVWYGTKAAGEKFDDPEAVMKRLFETRLTDPDLRASLLEFLLALLYVPDEAVKKFETEVQPILDQEKGIT